MSKFDQFDEEHYAKDAKDINESSQLSQQSFSTIVERAISRRFFLKSSAVGGLSAFAFTSLATGLGVKNLEAMGRVGGRPAITFEPVSASSEDTIRVPEGYNWDVLISWGDPILPGGKEFDESTRGDAFSQEMAFGDNNDGMALFVIDDNRAVLAVNNEYVNPEWLHVAGEAKSSDDVKKEMAAMGVSVFEINKVNDRWQVVRDSKYNRRITVNSPMEIVGPARGHDLLKTSDDPSGTKSLGTWNNCANGKTPWGTYLTCEENFNGYFGSNDKSYQSNDNEMRYGIGVKSYASWYKYDDRFDIAKEPNEPNRAGYVVEIDPMNPKSTPRKLTALGRFKHENAEVVIADNKKVVVYLGDDERGDYLYRFVSKQNYIPGNDAHNRTLLEEGTLYVAKFDDADEGMASEGKIMGKGRWIPLVYGENGLTAGNGFSDQASISVFTRKAADTVGATPMDRPEWVAANPLKPEVCCALTNNKNRGVKKNAGGIDQFAMGPNPRDKNNYGQIVRWVPAKGDHSASDFDWDLFVMAGNPLVKDGLYSGSENINKDNMFNSPDGLQYDAEGRLWIETDGNYTDKGEFSGMGNNQMLCAHTDTGVIKRFLTGPVACEITGISWSPDRKTMFVGVQHPGEEKQASTFPNNGVPRSSIVAIWKEDGGFIGT